jgi:hypothetical protein
MNSLEATGSVVTALEALKIEYMLVGAFSSNAYGIPRSTKDADFVVVLEAGDLSRIMDRLDDDFRLDRQIQFETITRSTKNVIIYTPTKFEIELFRLGKDEHHKERFRRRVLREMGELGTEVWIPTAEDVIIQKLRWARRKDLDDVESVLGVSGSQLDWRYVFRWTDGHKTSELLRQLCHEVPGLDLAPEWK